MVRAFIRAKLLKALSSVAALFVATLLSPALKAETFDKPLQQKVVDLGPSPELFPRMEEHVKLTCSYYPNFMVKELNNPGLKGAALIAIVPARPGLVATCTTHPSAGERAPKNWQGGYFGGVKRDLVFLRDADGTDGGLGFTAFNYKAQAKVFRDSVWLADISARLDSSLDFVPAPNGQITFRYIRVISGDCSLPREGAACWSKFQKQPGLKLAPMPTCNGYQAADITSPSVISYPVEVSLFPKPSMSSLSGPVKCYPPD